MTVTLGINKKQAIDLCQRAAAEPLGIIVKTNNPTVFIQALYRARKTDPFLYNLQFRSTVEGVAICHPPLPEAPDAAKS